MISTARYEVARSDAAEPLGIRLDVPVLRTRRLREAALPREAVRFLTALRELGL